MDNLDYLISAFEKIHKGLTLEAGMAKRMVNDLFRDVELIRNTLQEPHSIDPEKMEHRIVD